MSHGTDNLPEDGLEDCDVSYLSFDETASKPLLATLHGTCTKIKINRQKVFLRRMEEIYHNGDTGCVVLLTNQLL